MINLLSNYFFDIYKEISLDELFVCELNREELKIENDISLLLSNASITYKKLNVTELNCKYFIIQWKGTNEGVLVAIEALRARDCTITYLVPLIKNSNWSMIWPYDIDTQDFYNKVVEYKDLVKKYEALSAPQIAKMEMLLKVIEDSSKEYSLLSFILLVNNFTTPDFRENENIYTDNYVNEILPKALDNINNIIQSLKNKVEEVTAEKKTNQKIIENVKNSADMADQLMKRYTELSDLIPLDTRIYLLGDLGKLKHTSQASPDYSRIIEFLNTSLSLPWGQEDNFPFTLKEISNKLNNTHYGLSDVKRAILEHIALEQHLKKNAGDIICLVGPPGVGKTSIAKSVAESLGRKVIKIALGGLDDESELRGHRRSYMGAEQSRLVNEIIKCKSFNPVIIFDEIDKLGNSNTKGSPADALLEILDPEQNNHFVDRYLSFPINLSNCLFICTANNKNTIPPALLDRMNIIDVKGYNQEEQLNIIKNYIIPKYKQQWNISFDIEDSIVERLAINDRIGMRDGERLIKDIFKKSIYYSSLEEVKLEKVDLSLLQKLEIDISSYLKVNKNTKSVGYFNG